MGFNLLIMPNIRTEGPLPPGLSSGSEIMTFQVKYSRLVQNDTLNPFDPDHY